MLRDITTSVRVNRITSSLKAHKNDSICEAPRKVHFTEEGGAAMGRSTNDSHVRRNKTGKATGRVTENAQEGDGTNYSSHWQ